MRSFAFLLLAGCAASEAPAPPAPATEAVAVDAPSRGRSVEEQARSAESERWYELALGWFNKGDFDKAKEAARRAVQVNPENLSARKLLGDIHSIVGDAGPIPTPAEHDVRVALVRTEQAQIEITKHVVDGRRYLGAKMHASARKEFETAELKIRALPYDVAALNAMLPEIRAGIAATR
ncbi:MAG TPA: tetratricopeptide repeat protein [Planctomycetota bacterium]